MVNKDTKNEGNYILDKGGEVGSEYWGYNLVEGPFYDRYDNEYHKYLSGVYANAIDNHYVLIFSIITAQDSVFGVEHNPIKADKRLYQKIISIINKDAKSWGMKSLEDQTEHAKSIDE